MKFKIVYGDPPWPEQKTVGTPRHGADRHFKTMSIAQIANLRVKQAVEENAACFLWTTGRHIIKAGYTVLPAWGFQFVTVAFVWAKMTEKGKIAATLGYYTNPSVEFCLLGVRGHGMRPADAAVKQIYFGPRAKPLATKPLEIRRRIERLYPDSYRLELFGRERHPGWVVLGNEIDGSDINVALRELEKSRPSTVRPADYLTPTARS